MESLFNKELLSERARIFDAKRIGRETIQYVSNIYKYYLAYQFGLQHEEE